MTAGASLRMTAGALLRMTAGISLLAPTQVILSFFCEESDFLTDRSFPQGDASSLFAQDDSRNFAPCDEEVVIKPPKRESAPFSVW